MHLILLNFKINQKVLLKIKPTVDANTVPEWQQCHFWMIFFFPKSKSETKISHKCDLLKAESAVPLDC